MAWHVRGVTVEWIRDSVPFECVADRFLFYKFEKEIRSIKEEQHKLAVTIPLTGLSFLLFLFKNAPITRGRYNGQGPIRWRSRIVRSLHPPTLRQRNSIHWICSNTWSAPRTKIMLSSGIYFSWTKSERGTQLSFLSVYNRQTTDVVDLAW